MLELLFLINSTRINPVALDVIITERAQARADYLCETGAFSHTGWNAGLQGLGYRYLGENLAEGFRTAEDAHEALMASPTHHANIVKPEYSRVGIAEGKCGVIVELFGGV